MAHATPFRLHPFAHERRRRYKQRHLAAVGQGAADFLGPDRTRLHVFFILKNPRGQGFSRPDDSPRLIAVA